MTFEDFYKMIEAFNPVTYRIYIEHVTGKNTPL